MFDPHCQAQACLSFRFFLILLSPRSIVIGNEGCTDSKFYYRKDHTNQGGLSMDAVGVIAPMVS